MPLQGSTNHVEPVVGQRDSYLKTMLGNISKASLKHIDPSIRSGVMLAEDIQGQELLCTNRSGDPNSTLEEMVLEDGDEGFFLILISAIFSCFIIFII